MIRTWHITLPSVFVLALAITNPISADELAPPSGDPAILPPEARLEKLWDEGDFTEGPAVGPDGTIYFSDITDGSKPGRILRFDPGSGETSVFSPDSGQSNGLMFDRNGRLIACCGANNGKRALCRVDEEGKVHVIIDRYKGNRLNAPNDLVIHPDGSIYFSDPRYVGPEPVELDHMSVYRYEPRSRTLKRVTTKVTKPNGLVLSPDAKTMYIAETDNETLRMKLWAYEVRTDGTLGPRKELADYGEQTGVDGMAVDQQGHVYAAVRSADRFGIVVYTPQGEEKAYIPTPVLPTNCVFGIGEEASTLYVTAGTGLFRIRLKIPGYHPVGKG
jgi:gluconolactonase